MYFCKETSNVYTNINSKCQTKDKNIYIKEYSRQKCPQFDYFRINSIIKSLGPGSLIIFII